MVSTRRMESSGSAHDSGPHRLHSRQGKTNEEDDDDDEEGGAEEEEEDDDDDEHLTPTSSNTEPSQEEESWSSQFLNEKSRKPSRVRELRNRFVCGEHKFSPARRLRSQVVRSCRSRVSLDERGRIYSPEEMHDESDDFIMDREDSDEIFSPRRRSGRMPHESSRHSRHTRHTVISAVERHRMVRREALSLRPVKPKSYITRNAPCSSGSEQEIHRIGIRRSTRQKKLQYDTFNTSWITDAQMVKGYPNFNADFISDQEDSRHSQENSHKPHDESPHNRRDIKKNSKYMFEFDTTIGLRRRRTSGRNQELIKDEKNVEDEGEEKTKGSRINGKRTDVKSPPIKEAKVNGSSEMDASMIKEEADKDDEEADESKEKNDVGKNDSKDDRIKTRQQQQDKNDDSSDSEQEIGRLRTRRQCGRIDNNRGRSQGNSRQQSEQLRDKSSSSSDDEIRNHRRYSLRQRKPKSQPFQVPGMPKHIPYIMTRRRREILNLRNEGGSDTSSTDSDDLICKPKRKNQNIKTDQPLKSGSRSVPVPIDPETLDTKVRFSSIGGLDGHIQCLKEMVVLPMMYPDVFKQFQIQPPRGVLFHGPPGTGKTLIARALANECSFGAKRVSFFMRKGADLLSKWVGESEKQLRLLFEQAGQMKPSIIFFDELDGLAPVRMTRQDQNHASIVSTLLALMDGLDNRGEVIVIGATNRIDAIDPALRRPGRFDRELFFPLPARREREEILKVHVAQWTEPPSSELISHLAEHAAGYCGSDLRALCSEAVIQGFRRTYPQVYTADYRLQLDPTKVKVEKVDFLRAKSLLVPASHRIGASAGRKLSPVIEPLLKEPLAQIINLLKESYPHGTNVALASIKVSATIRPAQLLITGSDASFGQTLHVAPALLQHMEHVHPHTLDLATLYRESARSPEEACVQVFSEARRNVPSVIYIPSVDLWWSLISDTVKAIFLSQVASLDPNVPILLLATSDVEYKSLPEQISSIFSRYRREVVRMHTPSNVQREAFFHSLIIGSSLRPPRQPRTRPKTPPPLPKAPTPPPEPLSKEDMDKLYSREENTLTELRIFLRDMCKKLACNKQFYMFTKPVDLEEVPDYMNIIKQPMDLETMMTKVDLQRYSCAREFLADIDLICQNALEYNPDKTPADKQIRHRACSLRDHAYALFKAEMDTDFEDQCRTIAKKRRERKASVTQFLPAYIHTPSMAKQVLDKTLTEDAAGVETPQTPTKMNSSMSSIGMSSSRKRRPQPAWKQGYLSKKRRRINRHILTETPGLENSTSKISSGDESKENNPEICVMDTAAINIPTPDSVTEEGSIPEATTPVDITTPLSVNCDAPAISPTKLNSPIPSPQSRTNLTETMLSPSDILNEPLDFDDIDEALKETIGSNSEENCQHPLEINKEALDLVLQRAVNITKQCTVLQLLDLYNQLGKVIRKYARTHERNKLPKDLHTELTRFSKDNESPPV